MAGITLLHPHGAARCHRTGKGALIATRGVSEDAAFQILVGTSQRENITLAVVAQRIVDSLDRPRT